MRSVVLNLVLILGLLFIMTSCKKDGDSAPTLLGKWTLVSYQISNFENSGKIIDDSQHSTIRPTFEFKNDGTIITDFGRNPIINYTIKNSKLILDRVLAYETHDSFDITFSENMLTLTRVDVYSYQESYTERTTIILKKIN